MPMPTVEDAIALATHAHAGQVDKAGQPYIEHILRVVRQLPDAEGQMLAALHDVCENCTYTLADLAAMGYPASMLQALECITKRHGEPYEAYIQRVKANPLARRVKLADLRDNMDMRRLAQPTQKDWDRLAKYQRAWSELQLPGELTPSVVVPA
jgi:(p)ppGpp synthase/HD superfamily hydrolase